MSRITISVAVLIAGIHTASAQLVQAPSSPFSLGPNTSPISIAVGNLNNDSIPDLAVANLTGNSVSVYLSNGTSGLYPAMPSQTFTVGTEPSFIAMGDFNKDGNVDLVIANRGSGNVTIALNQGNGVFSAGSSILRATGSMPVSVAVRDFNGDGNLDLAIANLGSNNVTVLLGDGTGNFQPSSASPFPVGNSPSSIAAGDFNGDGYPDLAITNELDNTVTVLLGNGSGGFTASTASPFTAGYGPSAVAVADFNLDGNQDLAVANLSSNNVTILLGNGAGNFTAASTGAVAVGTMPVSLAEADFNGDGIPDLAVANSGSNNVTVLLGSGTGGFKPSPGSPYATGAGIPSPSNPNPVSPQTPSNPMSLAVGDFNQFVQQNQLGLAVANHGQDSVTIFQNIFTISPTMVSAASFTAGGSVAPGSIVSIFSPGIGSAPAMTASMLPLPTCWAGTSVTMTDASGATSNRFSLFYAGPTQAGAIQINAEVPSNVATGAGTFSISTSSDPMCSPSGTLIGAPLKGSLTVAAVAPALFTANSNGKGVASAQLVSNVLGGSTMQVYNCPAPEKCVPAPLEVSSGDTALVLYGTGIRNRASLSNVTVTIAGQAFQPFYAGMSADSGEDQVNVSLPASLAGSGTVFVTVSVSGAMSNQATICLESLPGQPSICAPTLGS